MLGMPLLTSEKKKERLVAKNAKRMALINASAKLFKEKGFTLSSMRLIAENLGVEAASIYNYISSKEEILEIICFDIANKYMEHIEIVEKQQNSYLDKLKEIINFHINLIVEQRNFVSVVNNDWKYLSKPKMQKFVALRNKYESKLANIVTQGVNSKEFKPLNVSVAIFTILSALRWIELWYKPTRNIDKEDLINDVLEILIKGISK